MVEPAALLSAAPLFAAAALSAVLGVYLALLPGRRFARSCFATLVILHAGVLTARGASLVAEGPVPHFEPFVADLQVAGNVVVILLLWRFPTPPPRRSLDSLVLAVALGYAVLTGATWFLARDFLQQGPAFRFTLQWHLLGPYAEPMGILHGLVLLLAYRRLDRAPRERRRGDALILLALAFATLSAPAVALSAWILQAIGAGGPFQPSAFGPIPGDPLGLVAALWVAQWLVVPLAILGRELLRRHPLPALAALGMFAASLVGGLTGVDLALVFTPLGVGLPAYAIARHGSLGVPEVPRPLAAIVAATAALAAFILLDALVLGIDPGNPLLVGPAVLVGLLGAAAVALAVAPRLRVLVRAAPPDGIVSRIAPYAEVLREELASGRDGASLHERLRPLRARLGVSDHEHAVLLHALAPRRPVAPGTGERFLDRYRVLRTLREGGFGVTRLCRDERLDRDVVLKTLRAPDASGGGLDALLAEAKALARVRHPHVVTVLDADRVGEEAFLVMEHVPGGSLADRLARGPLTQEEFARVSTGLLSALEAVHAAGLVHRDVKPSNILLGASGEAKLADFGVAHIPGFETTVAVAGAVGTVRYMSPEQARGRPVGPASDLYAAAATLYEAWTGRPLLEPLPGESAVELQMRAAAASGLAAPLEEAPALSAWFRRALDPEPALRHAHAREMREALAAALDAQTPARR